MVTVVELLEQVILEIVGVRDPTRHSGVAVVVVCVSRQPVVGVIRIRHRARQQRNGRVQRQPVADVVIRTALGPVVGCRIARNRFRLQPIVVVIAVGHIAAVQFRESGTISRVARSPQAARRL